MTRAQLAKELRRWAKQVDPASVMKAGSVLKRLLVQAAEELEKK